MSKGGSRAVKTLAEKLDYLFTTVHPGDRGEYSNQEVADALHERGGPTISATYVWQLRRGDRDNPTKRHLEALAEFFGVPVSYFFDETTERIDAELALLAAIRDAGVRHIALRASALPPESLESIRQIIEVMRGVNGLPVDGATAGGDVSPGRSRTITRRARRAADPVRRSAAAVSPVTTRRVPPSS